MPGMPPNKDGRVAALLLLVVIPLFVLLSAAATH